MSGTDNMDEDVQMDGNISTDATPFQGVAYPPDDIPTQSVGSNLSTGPGKTKSSAIPLMANKDDKCYYMKHKKRGNCLIFNLERIPDLEVRLGSAKDVENLDKTFSSLGFDVKQHIDNVTVDNLRTILKDAAANADFESDCLVVIFMSHGEADDKLWAKDKRFFAKELWEPFYADKCPALVGKPKLFFIQACRGNKMAQSAFVKDAGTRKDNKTTYTLPNQCDILTAHSTIEGHQAARNVNDGSWFIQSLCQELNENGRNESLLSLLTSVNRRVALGYACKKAQDEEILKQQPVIISTLTRELFF